ncbi:MAG: glycosyl transferase, partial [Desulfuromonadales bacterium]|nr:glycosyl transferase [Desulfuromonadales bacterium]NIS43905.1 glycosyl transferase [Desulfuromonadales bacterium]
AASEGGRARQLNAGALKASAENLLFLHVDSVFPDPKTLARALEELDRSIAVAGTDAVAGHFRLKFSRTDESSSFGYYFWEVKARLDRSECTHGDQGCLLRKSFFAAVGPFAADLPIAEDTRLAERIRDVGRWILLSPEIWTSARRFEVEGLRERQTLNALIMNFAAIDWADFFAAAKSVYRSQAAADKL